MGSVYLARHVVIGRELAVKLLHTELTGNKDVVKRFFREAQATAQIKHRGIIDVFDMGLTEWGEPYLAMEYLTGESLNNTLSRAGTLSLAAVLGIIEPILSALSATHRKEIIHRDIKPSNIFIATDKESPPAVKLIDFGISKFSRAETNITRTGMLLGTLDYMAPEQLRGEPDISAAADLWSIGIVMYEMLSGYLPFSGDNFNARYISVLTEDPVPLRSVLPDCSEEVELLVMRALNRESADRYADAEEMLTALSALPEFADRERALLDVAAGLRDLSSATGDLGQEEAVGSSDIAKEMLEQAMREATPSGMAGTFGTQLTSRKSETAGKSVSTSSKWTGTAVGPARPKRGLLIGLMGLVTAIVAGVALGIFAMKDDSKDTLKVPVQPPADRIEAKTPADPNEKQAQEALSKEVAITVNGVPEGAKIFFDDRQMPRAKFLTDRSEETATLKVTAPGYRPFIASVLPARDTTIDVALIAAVGAGATADTPASKPERESRHQRRSKKHKDQKKENDKKSTTDQPDPSSKPEKKKGGFVEDFE